jgi:hypothetical protein
VGGGGRRRRWCRAGHLGAATRPWAPSPRFPFVHDVNMLVSTGGRQRRQEEFRALYERAGFTLERIVPTGMASVIEGRRM